jgi:uncharacterized membrane protein (GlpM family)
MNPIFYYALQFILGGASVVGITLIARYIDPKYTGIVYALPIILVVAMIFIYLNQGLEISQRTLKSTFIYEFTLVFFVLAFWLLLYRVNFWLAITISLLSWATIATFIQFWLKI